MQEEMGAAMTKLISEEGGSTSRDSWTRTYVNTSVPYPNDKVSASLCIGEAVRYEIRKGSGVDDAWILKVPQDMTNIVKSQYALICALELTFNPIRKVDFVVCGHEGQLFIDNLIVAGEDEAACSNDKTSSATSSDVTYLNKKRQRQSARRTKRNEDTSKQES